MKPKSLRERLTRLGARCGQGAGELTISAAEGRLSLSLPPSYRAFLEEVGWAEIGALGIAGLGSDVPADLSLEGAARAAWEEGGVSRRFLAFADEEGDCLFLDVGQGGEAPVMFRLAEEGRWEMVASSFGEWLEEELLGFEGEEDEFEGEEEE